MRRALLFLALALPPAVERVVEPSFGFALEVPEGWTSSERERAEDRLQLVLAPEDGGSMVQLSVHVYRERTVAGIAGAVAYSRTAFEADAKYSDLEEVEGEIAGRAAIGLECDAEVGAANLRVRQLYIAEHGFVYVVRTVAPAQGFDSRRDLARVWEGFELVALDAESASERALELLGARCGSEIDWAPSWKEAARRARDARRPILVTARRYPGFDLSDETMSGVFMDPDVVELVRERFVAFRLGELDLVPFSDPERYGLSPTTFGVAALVVTPEGEVVREGVAASHGFLLECLARLPRSRRSASPAKASRAERARALAGRGELEEALALLEEDGAEDGAQELRARASIERRLRREQDALATLALARSAPGADGIATDIDLDEALLLLGAGRPADARARIEAALAREPEHARAPEALFLLGVAGRALSGRDEAERTWLRLVDEHPEDRWAWKAAATLSSTTWKLDLGKRIERLDETLLPWIAAPDYAPLLPREAERAVLDALEWLLAAQREDGSWASLTELGRPPGAPPDDFTLAIGAICVQGLLPWRERPEVLRALERGLAWMRSAYESARAAAPEIYFMDYGTWSRSFLLWSFADCVEAGLVERDALAATVASLLAELAQKQRASGGWSYYFTSTAGSQTPADARSISFVTAAAVLALQRAREVGFDVPEELVARGLDCLEAARGPDGVFAYFVDERGARTSTGRAGAAGRGPACALALYLGERGARDARKALSEALEDFVDLRGGLASELGKVLMHTGADGQGSHYLLFDYALAARAAAELPRGERARFRLPILEEVLRARTSEGTFVDNAGRGRDYGAGMALVALALLR